MRSGRIHPTIEALVWAYGIGKPVEIVQLDATVTSTRVDQDRERLRMLDVHQLGALLAESEVLVERAIAQAKAQYALPPAGKPKELPASPDTDPAEPMPHSSDR
jgi:hypothetical protein